MRYGLVLASLIGALSVSQPGWAVEHFPRWCVGLTGGANFLSESDYGNGGTTIDYDVGPGMGVALGYRPVSLPGVRVEVEGVYSNNSVDTIKLGGVTVAGSGDVSTVGGMLNLYYDFRNSTRFTPYIGLGGGFINVDYDDGTGTTGDDYTYAYQARVGLAYTPEIFYDVVDLVFGYRFFGAGDAKINGADLDITSHTAEIGARLHF